jgi:hypothetical protein
MRKSFITGESCTHRREERCIQSFCSKTYVKRPLERPRRRWEGGIAIGWRMWTVFFLVRMVASGGFHELAPIMVEMCMHAESLWAYAGGVVGANQRGIP